MAQQIISNLKLIVSGVIPTIVNLLKGQVAIGKVGGKSKIFVNATGSAVEEYTLGPDVVQTTGTSTEDVMSQYAVTQAFLKKAGDIMTAALTLSGDPTQALHAVTKQYADAIAQGLSVKESCRATTTANIALSGIQTIDGVLLAVGNRVLVKNQTAAAQNGIYIVASGAWTRATDADTSAKVKNNLFVFINEGVIAADSGWTMTNDGTVTLGTTALNFTQFSGAGQILVGAGLEKNGNQIYLANSGVAAGTYTKVTVDIYGRVTSATQLTLAELGGEPAFVKKSAFNVDFETAAGNIKMNGTASAGTSGNVARADHVHPTDTTRAPLASPAFTGTPIAPTAAAGTSNTQIATTAFVDGEIPSAVTVEFI